MLEKPADELFRRQRAVSGLAGIADCVPKRDLVILHADNAVVAECDAKDVGGQILQSG